MTPADRIAAELAQMAPGLHSELPDEYYRATKAVSCSTLKRFAEAPAKALTEAADALEAQEVKP